MPSESILDILKIMNQPKELNPKKHPCSDCEFCQWCSSDRCSMCKGSCSKKNKPKKKKGHQPLFRSY